MSTISSPLGRRTSHGGDMKVFKVEEPQTHSQPIPVSRDEILRQRLGDVNVNSQRELETVRNRLEVILGIGRAYKKIPISTPNGSIEYTVRTHKSNETRVIHEITVDISLAQKENDFKSMANHSRSLKEHTVAFSIEAIDGISIDSILGIDASDLEYINDKLYFVSNLDDSIVERLYLEIGALLKENSKANSFVSVSEEAEAIKKSR